MHRAHNTVHILFLYEELFPTDIPFTCRSIRMNPANTESWTVHTDSRHTGESGKRKSRRRSLISMETIHCFMLQGMP
jgi:hypothetical protein